MGNDYPEKHEGCLLRRVKTFAAFLFAALLSSCICGGGSPNVTMQYAIEYPPPSFSKPVRLDAKLGVERFSAARAFRGHGMVYSPKPFREDSYNYSRWIADPADMLGDHLLRDLRASGLFKAVFSYCDSEEPRFEVQGGVERIIETDRGDASEAALAVNIILLDRGEGKYQERVMFQKTYHAAGPITKRTAEDFAKGMSGAAARLSKEIISDVYEGIRETLSQEAAAGRQR